jgi:pyridoxamine 5'-phosphate oxidase
VIDPISQIERLLGEATRRGAPEPYAMALATARQNGAPAVRYVLLRGIDARGFVFYTDARSRKGGELRSNPRAALALYWNAIGKQARIEGRVEEVEPELADAYWSSRDRGKRLAAIASTQSAPLAERADLLDRFRRLRAVYGSKEIPRPACWTGFRIVPRSIELWTNRADRLHHRELFVFRRGAWQRRLLQP